MASVRLDLTFPHEYEVVLIEESTSAPGGARQMVYSVDPEKRDREGLVVRIVPNQGSAWTGTFTYGTVTPGAVSGVFSMPDGHSICVVASGEGYLVRTDSPENWQEIQCHPIWDVRPIRDRNLLIFADYTHLVAYGREGLVWKTDRISWEGLQIQEITADQIRGTALDAPAEREFEFSVDLATGKVHVPEKLEI